MTHPLFARLLVPLFLILLSVPAAGQLPPPWNVTSNAVTSNTAAPNPTLPNPAAPPAQDELVTWAAPDTGAASASADLATQETVDTTAPPFRLDEWFPESLHRKRFLIADYQWISLLAVIILGIVADIGVRFAMHHLAIAWYRVLRTHGGQHTEQKLWRPVGLLAQALVWYGGTMLVNLPPQISLVLSLGLKFFGVWVTVWTAFQWIDILSAYFARRASMTTSKFDDLLIPLLSKSIKIFVVCLGVLFCAETFNLPITGLIGGLGLGGAALAFASKDAISNLFGSLTVLVDRPFEIGDWIIIDGVQGSVEQVGFRSTRIRTSHSSQISIPNSTFTTAVVDNMGRRRYQRVNTTLGLDYNTTTEQIDAFCEGIRELLRRHPYTRKDSIQVYFNQFGEASLGILVNFFLTCPDRPTELQSQHDLFLDIMRLAQALGVSFALPTKTMMLLQNESASEGNTLEFKQPTETGRHEAARVVEQRARGLVA